MADPTEELLRDAQARTSTIVMITNLTEDRWNNLDVLEEYKGQTAVETRFRNPKAPPCIYVKSSRWAEALAYLFLMALIVASYIEIKIRQELKVRREQFLVPGNRLTERPAMTDFNLRHHADRPRDDRAYTTRRRTRLTDEQRSAREADPRINRI